MKRNSSKAEKKYLAEVARMGCIVCESMGFFDTPSLVHHVRERHGWGRTSHFATIPLCYEHHVGKTGVHSMGREQFTHMYGKSEIDFMKTVQGRMKRKDASWASFIEEY